MRKIILLFFIVAAVEVQAQNVGIGTTQPKANLHIRGQATIENPDLWLNSSDIFGATRLKISPPGIPGKYWLMQSSLDTDINNPNNYLLFYRVTDSASGAGIPSLLINKDGYLGIGSLNPTAPLSFAQTLGKKISLYPGNTGDVGIAVFGNELRQYIDDANGNITFGFDNYANGFTERMRIQGNGNVGIGVTNPALGGLVVDRKVGATNAVFGSNTTGVAIESDYPGIGFNTYWNGGRKAIANGFGAYIGTDPVNGGLNFHVTDNSYTAGANANVYSAIAIKPNGNVGIGTTTANASLQFGNVDANRRIVLWETANNNHQFYGFGINGFTLRYQTPSSSDDHVFYSGAGAASSTELVRIKGNGNVGIGITDPAYRLDVKGRMRIRAEGATAGIWFNNSLNTQLRGFIGMENEDAFGFFGDAGAGWALRMSTSSGNIQLSNNLSVSGATNINGFTRLGESSPAIKTKLITGFTSGVPAGFADIPHGLDRSKIVGISILVTTIDGVDVGPGYFVNTGLLYNFQIRADDVRITNPILPVDYALVGGRPVRILLTYQE